MSRVLYFDCFSGISGDMALGALLDAGLLLEDLKAALGSLALGDTHVRAKKVLRAGLSATKFSVHEHAEGSTPHGHDHGEHDVGAHPPHRHLAAIYKLIDASALSFAGRDQTRSVDAVGSARRLRRRPRARENRLVECPDVQEQAADSCGVVA